MKHPWPGLRYVDVDDLEKSAADLDGMAVESSTGDSLGDLDGFIVDINAGRPYYVVVNSGGWFRSRFFLLPVGHVSLDSEDRKLVADLSREHVDRFPGFDRAEFEKLSAEDLNRMDEQIVRACCPTETIDRTAPSTRYARWAHYQYPSWWDASFYRPDRAGRLKIDEAVSYPSREDVRAARDGEREREQVVAKGGDVSSHPAGRAQPGDVIGLEEGGERTDLGDTSDDENDENKRRREAERAAAKKSTQ
jgi:hypothetical protein